MAIISGGAIRLRLHWAVHYSAILSMVRAPLLGKTAKQSKMANVPMGVIARNERKKNPPALFLITDQ
ncbi:hypothetical protein N7523_001883 [Penicillium sp. IBT 18751x]|nr:hypothetical protein N7523_001883 [Penicillium sp. IBT 18751x]